MPCEDEDVADQNPAESFSAPVSEVPVAAGQSSERASSAPPVFHPLAYRGVVANWPIEWREQWGRRANSLEEDGLTWRDAETQAFVEVWNQRRHQPSPDPDPSLTASTAGRN